MNYIVILFISGVSFNLQDIHQVDACLHKDVLMVSVREKNRANKDMKDFSKYIDRLKTNYIEELINLNFEATFRDIELLYDFEDELSEEKPENMTLSDQCSKDLMYEAAAIIKNVSDRYTQCVTDQFYRLTTLEDIFPSFFDSWSTCPLNINPFLGLVCSVESKSSPEWCIEVKNDLNATTKMPLECNEDEDNARKEHLKAVAENAVSEGILEATKCISEPQQEFDDRFITLIGIRLDCERNAN